ncbi:uncharacterized protein LOC122247598 [Penaeus japonicus]|uniref:uncharacterized protein LOC122247598 n=1 Tax=Penaeus japonicus TaxID=27405 RepID=UPI001C713F3F|nr:uncharacterized protein LOC122247598 [Penaeus japonicus]XP_042862931.1 uncharacterized protein LOC122247598 [Penaeus japonicus]
MSPVWLTLLLVGTASYTQAIEAESDPLQELDSRTFNTTSIAIGTVDPFSQLLLGLGNIGGFFNNLNLNLTNGVDPLDLSAALGGTAAGLGGAAAGLGALGTTFAALSSIKAAFFSLLVKPLEIANFVLAIIALAMLTIYFASGEGDLKTLIGTDVTGFLRRESDDVYDSYSGYVSQARALWDTSAVQSLTSLVYDAITKYD